jgi:hypothetical protein
MVHWAVYRWQLAISTWPLARQELHHEDPEETKNVNAKDRKENWHLAIGSCQFSAMGADFDFGNRQVLIAKCWVSQTSGRNSAASQVPEFQIRWQDVQIPGRGCSGMHAVRIDRLWWWKFF